MKNIIIQLIILFWCMIPTILAQNKIKQYEYWLDNDYATKQIVNITPTADLNLNAAIPISGLKTGIHRLHLRFLDTNNKYSSISTHSIEAFSANPKIASYEYWFDDNYAGKTVVPVTPTSVFDLNNIDLTSITEGRHLLYIRFSDAAAKWSAIQYGRILKSSDNSSAVNSISGYRYWIDNNFTNNVYKNFNANSAFLNMDESIDLTTFPKGSNHILNMQYKDKMGMWSAVQSTNFSNNGGGTLLFNAVAGYRYWIDGDFSNNIYQTTNPALACVSVNAMLDLTNFKGDNRLLRFQFKDISGLWSSVLTDTVNVIVNVGLNDLINDSDNIRVYPNPNNGEFILSSDADLTDVSIYIINTLGEIIYNNKLDILNSKWIRLKNVKQGIYFLQIEDGKHHKVLKTTKLIIGK